MRPMRRPLRSSTGMPLSSVTNKSLSAIENAPGAVQQERLCRQFPTLVLQVALHGFTDATFNMAHRAKQAPQKSDRGQTVRQVTLDGYGDCIPPRNLWTVARLRGLGAGWCGDRNPGR